MTLIEITGMRRRILYEASLLFTRCGYSAISMREIAEACGITKAALYYHFKDKEGLILAILSENLDEMGRIIRIARESDPSARRRLTAFIRAVFALPVEQRSGIRLASQEMSNLSPQARASFGQTYQAVFIGPLAEILAEGMQAGELRQADPHQLVWLLLGLMYPFFYPNPERQTGLEAVIDLMITVFFDGITRNER
jgi:AcrR family transcriptional regulator